MDVRGVVLRSRKGAKLTAAEMDNNLVYLESISAVELENIKEIIAAFRLEEKEEWSLVNEKIDDILEGSESLYGGLKELKNLIEFIDFDDSDILEKVIESKVDIIDFVLGEAQVIKNKIDDIKVDFGPIEKKLDDLDKKIDELDLDIDLSGVEGSLKKIEVGIDDIRRKQRIVGDTKYIVREVKNPITDIKRRTEKISILGISEVFDLKEGRLINKKGKDLKDFLPVLFYYEPIDSDLILVGIRDYKTKGDLIYLTYETEDKKTGVRKIFDAGLNLWDKYREKIKIEYEFSIKTS